MTINDQHSAQAQQIITDYARSWSLLQAYDQQSFKENEAKQDDMHALALPAVSVDEGLIKLEDPDNSSRRYAKYIPYWA